MHLLAAAVDAVLLHFGVELGAADAELAGRFPTIAVGPCERWFDEPLRERGNRLVQSHGLFARGGGGVLGRAQLDGGWQMRHVDELSAAKNGCPLDDVEELAHVARP